MLPRYFFSSLFFARAFFPVFALVPFRPPAVDKLTLIEILASGNVIVFWWRSFSFFHPGRAVPALTAWFLAFFFPEGSP